MCKNILTCFILIISLQYISGHGRMEEPPARNAAWRFGFNVPPNYDDVGLNCGGLSIHKANGGKCGVCGDSYSGPRDHELGGRYATNTIVRSYISGSTIDIKILLTANHVGFMELRLCPSLDPYKEVTQECLDQNILHIEGFDTQFPVTEGMDSIYLKARLPDSLSCSHCVLQWRYHAGNSWGTDPHLGRSCLGCGHQEEFYNCADISISSLDNNNDHQYNLFPIPTTTKEPIFVNPMVDRIVFPPEIQHMPINLDLPSTTTQSPPLVPSATTPMNFIIPYRSSEELMEQINKVNKTLRCFPTHEVLKPLVGIEDWCLQLCVVHCPPTLCACIQI